MLNRQKNPILLAHFQLCVCVLFVCFLGVGVGVVLVKNYICIRCLTSAVSWTRNVNELKQRQNQNFWIYFVLVYLRVSLST